MQATTIRYADDGSITLIETTVGEPGAGEVQVAGRRNLAASRVYVLPASVLANQFWVVEPVSCVVTGKGSLRLAIARAETSGGPSTGDGRTI